ncbi:MAG TPA: VOC family protein [Bryobacteraceae bacterium]|nr:VOC family protein [Bryobacteraceae bacterium]
MEKTQRATVETAVLECSFFGREATFHHIGMAVHSIRAICPSSEPVANELEGVSMVFLRLSGITIELLEPRGDSSPILNSLRRGIKFLHICYEVPQLAEAIALCRPAGFHRLGIPKPSQAFGGRRVAWVFSKQFGLFELLERNGAPV